MIEVYADGKTVYNSRLNDYALLGLTVTAALNKGGTAEFTMPPGHPAFERFINFKTIVEIFRDEELLFRGRALYPADDFYGRRTITCEGERCFLRDAVMRPYLYQDTPAAIFSDVIGVYNAQVEQPKQFQVGEVTVTDPNDYVRLESESAEQVGDTIDKLVERCGGYIVFTTNPKGRRVINWYAALGYPSTQAIEFGENLLDFSRTQASTDLVTRIIPYGAKDEETGERITIRSVNGDQDFIQDDEAVALRGVIARPVYWDDMTEPSNLLAKAKQYLASSKMVITTLQLSALDLSVLDVSINTLKVGGLILVKSKPHGVDDEFLLTERTYNLLDPSRDTVILGKNMATLTGADVAGDRDTIDQLHKTEASIKADYQLGIAQAVQASESKLSSLIEQTSEDIRLEVSNTFTEFSGSVTGSLTDLQAQIDGQIQTWFDSYIPTPGNAPASGWATEEEKINHLGDIFYIVDNQTMGGQAYRWAQVGGVYQWVLIEDVEVAKALADAARAQDTADGKRRVFVFQPVPPYDVGDLWAQGDGGDLMRCNTSRASGDYVAADWGKASDYTNDDALHEFMEGEYADTKDTVAQQGEQLTAQASQISELEVSANGISAEVNRIETTTSTALDGLNQTINDLSQRVSLSLTSDQVEIAIEEKLSQGVETVKTATGFTFDADGLTVSKSGSEMTTQVTEDGMTVSRSGSEVLVANNQGVQATNLNANTFLIIAGKARFEAYGADRIGCFWIGG